MKIVVCDDATEMTDEWVASISDLKLDEAEVIPMAQAQTEVSRLVNRKIAVKKGKDPNTVESSFDSIDVLVIDYDLVLLSHDGNRTTGEGIARLARTYSRCGAIVVMNQFKGPQFDLGMRGHLESFADVNIHAGLVNHQSLWVQQEPATRVFNPTIWTPMIDRLCSARDLAMKLDEAGLDAPVMALLGLSNDALTELSDSAYGFISLNTETSAQLAGVTVREFIARSLDKEIVKSLEESSANPLSSFASFRLAKWLDRAVLRPMDVLIDTAHLIDRFPFLLAGDASDPTICNAASMSPREKLKWEEISNFHNEAASSVLGRFVFDWYRMESDAALAEMQDQFIKTCEDRLHLAEDTTCFVTNDALTRFRADFHNFGDHRAIEYLDDITYGPLRRLKFG